MDHWWGCLELSEGKANMLLSYFTSEESVDELITL
jgi:hypothetical protein